jgi:transposase
LVGWLVGCCCCCCCCFHLSLDRSIDRSEPLKARRYMHACAYI